MRARQEVRACVHMHRAYARVHQVEPGTVSRCFPTDIPRGAKKTERNRRRANPLRSHSARNVLRLAPTSDTQSRGTPACAANRHRPTTVEIVENCDLHARHTPVSADDSSTNIEEMKEVEIKRGGLISKHFPDMRAHIMSVTNGMCINVSHTSRN